jgi:hypothetical protein
VAARDGKLSSGLRDTVLVSQLKKLNQIEFKCETHPLSEATIRTAIAGKRKETATGPIWLMGANATSLFNNSR